jgi:hypothetical protein
MDTGVGRRLNEKDSSMDPVSIALLAVLALRIGWPAVRHIQRPYRDSG